MDGDCPRETQWNLGDLSLDLPSLFYSPAHIVRYDTRAIGKLDEDHRLLLVLRDVEELSYEEIMQVTGLPEGTVKSRLHRARQVLKEEITRNTK